MSKREEIQKQAQQAWIRSGRRNSLQIATGVGKTFISLQIVKLYPKTAKILFLAEVTDRELELRNEQKKWGVEDYDIEFACYQTACKWVNRDFDLVIADEAVDSFTPVYSQFYFNNRYKHLLCLFAYLDAELVVDEKDGKRITKGDLCKIIAPICFTYTMDEAQKDETYRKLNIYVINHKLDSISKNVEAGNAQKKFFVTEQNAYEWAEENFKKKWKEHRGNFENFHIKTAAHKRMKVLYELPSKIQATKKLLSHIDSKTILFGNSLQALGQITPNVISSHNSDSENETIRTSFDNGKINLIGSFKKLQQGANLVDLDNVIMMSYYSKQKIAIQRTGRLRQNNKIGRIFIFVTKGTQEEKWYKKMFEGMDNLNFINCVGIDDCINKITGNVGIFAEISQKNPQKKNVMEEKKQPAEKDYVVSYFDGACEPKNPGGNMGMGAFVLNKKRERIFTYSEYIASSKLEGQTSNNIAEYMSLIKVLEFFVKENLQSEKIIICGDSQLVIKQMTGEYGCNGGLYTPYYKKAIELSKQFSNIRWEWIPREKNSVADELSKRELIKNGCSFRIQPLSTGKKIGS